MYVDSTSTQQSYKRRRMKMHSHFFLGGGEGGGKREFEMLEGISEAERIIIWDRSSPSCQFNEAE